MNLERIAMLRAEEQMRSDAWRHDTAVTPVRREVCYLGHPMDGQRTRHGRVISYCKTCAMEAQRRRREAAPLAERGEGQEACACGRALAKWNKSGVCATCQNAGCVRRKTA